MECKCENDDALAGWWQGTNNVQMGAFTVVGYLLYRFSQTLPALIRWPIRLFCSLTGLSALWGWVGRVVGTLRGIQSLCKSLSKVWRFIKAFSSKFKWLVAVIRAITGSSDIDPPSSSLKPGLRLILLGPVGSGHTSPAIFANNNEANTPKGPLMESTLRKTVIDGREITLIDTPDLLGSSMENTAKAKEALRALQLANPGPHTFLLVIQAPGSNMGVDQDAAKAIRNTLELFGDSAVDYILPVFTHPGNHERDTLEMDKLLDVDSGGLKKVLSLCNQRPELVDNGPNCTPEEQSEVHRRLLGRVTEMGNVRELFVHELQRREDRLKEELLGDMAHALSRKLGHM